MSKNHYVVLAVAAMAVTLFFQNCSPFAAFRSQGKSDVVKRVVFATDLDIRTSPEFTVGEEIVAQLPVEPGCIGQGCTAGVQDQSRSLEIPVKYYCSDDWTAIQNGRNVLSLESLEVTFVNESGIACQLEGSKIRDTVLSQKILDLKFPAGTCTGMTSGRYTVYVHDPKDTIVPGEGSLAKKGLARQSLLIGNHNHDSGVPFVVDLLVPQSGPIKLTQVNPEKKAGAYILWKDRQDQVGADGRTLNDSLCDAKNSPLVIQMTDRPRKIRLVNPLLGILFDLLGINDTPAHTKRRISWFGRRDAHEHLWITLPDAYGQVSGIDQLFGNNTVGPDGRTASDGYAALAKWDRNQDGQITADDPVYRSLRFWADRNVNGLAEPVELSDAVYLGIVRIDLDYDPNYSETDKWGNEIKMKSVVEMYDGKLNLMYDIWFRKVD
jgi:hypothetical protein